MSEWNEIRFSEIATVIMGQSPASEFYNNDGNGLPFMQGNRTFGDRYPTIDTYTTQITKKVSKGSILMSVRAPVGDINIAPLEMCIGRGLCAITAKDGNNEFVRYLLNYNMPKLKSSENGTTFTAINGDNIKNLKILVPDLPTQKRIAEILSAYDDLIENNNRRIALLEKAAQELYKEWFVRFRFPGYENAKFENGLPAGWNVKRLADYGKVETGKTPSTEVLENYGCEIMFVKTPDMHGNLFTIQTGEYLSKQGHLTQPKKLLPPNSIMVSCIGTGGVVSINAEQAHTNQQINSIILDNSMFLEWLFFTCKALKETIELFGATGATMTNLSKGKFEKLKVIEPKEELISLFHDKVFPIFDEIKALMYNNKNLAKQRDLLLPRLMSGKLEV